ncbi:DnaJ-like protein subfamily C member 14 [Nymphaea thermarum]|nr:DnaJ-like protein subfamily C member 14 [Nymphaea thermarum]
MMARKGTVLRSSMYQNGIAHDNAVSKSTPLSANKDMVHGAVVVDDEELSSLNCQHKSNSPSTDQVDKNITAGARKRSQTKSNRRDQHREKAKTPDVTSSSTPPSFVLNDPSQNISDATRIDEYEDGNCNQMEGDGKSEGCSKFCLGSGFGKMMGSLSLSDKMGGRNLRASAVAALDKASRWFQAQKVWVSTLTAKFLKARNYVIQKSGYMYPILSKWLRHIGKLILLVSLVWLDCALRGVDSIFRLGTASFFTILWCSSLAFASMIGITNLLIVSVISGTIAYFLGLTLAVIVVAAFASAFLWFYGSFWITGLFIVFGGITFTLKFERLALLVTTIYAVFCAKFYVGWSGLLLGINLAFISSDVLIYFIKKNVKENKESSEPGERAQGDGFSGHAAHAAFSDESFRTAFGVSPDQGQGVASTSGQAEIELTSEEEVERLLNCVDHYSVLGLSRYQSIDISSLKREYKKKAMLVHPDKNLSNEKAVEAFKKLQNAYEVLLDSIKRKAYDDELRREELFNCFRRFQTAYQKKGRQGFFPSGFSHSEAKEDDSHEEVRRIECKRCNKFHIWSHTSRSKAQARWCQECKEFHNAKDGDGWVEQCGHPFLFGMLQKVDPPHAYVCADSKIYDATDWFLCQGMRCPVNTHKPSFHVNTTVATKHNMRGGSSAHRTGTMPPSMDETITEEAFFEWLQNAMQSGVFESNGTSESSASKSSNGPKSSAGKKKKRGKKQW